MKNILIASSILCLLGIGLAGCDGETHGDPAIIKSMNEQRAAQTKGMQDNKGAVPGAANSGVKLNPYTGKPLENK